jgi:hypothetical protein
MRLQYFVLGGAILGLSGACSSDSPSGSLIGGSGNAGASAGGAAGNGANAGGPNGVGAGGFIDFGDAGTDCAPKTCAQLGWACGYTIDVCGNVINCADEGLVCPGTEVCVGGIDGPTECVAGQGPSCEVCDAVAACDAASPTRLTGRVVTPGRDDQNVANQVGVPNAVVYIMRNNSVADLPAITTGIPSDGESCDRCEDQDLGPLLTGAITDATGGFTLETNVPVGVDFLLVVKVGKFRRAITYALPAEAACTTTTLPTVLPGNPTHLPRSMSDGLAVNLPQIAVTTGQIDAMECVFEKMGIAQAEFGNFGSASRVHLYRGGVSSAAQGGAVIDGSTPFDGDLYTSLPRMQSYDMVVADCEGQAWDATPASPQRVASGANVREYVNRGGRMFASHLSFTWLNQNDPAGAPASVFDTGVGAAATWRQQTFYTDSTGTGHISLGRAKASSRIDNFAAWMANESVPDPFTITDPRSMVEPGADAVGASSEEFVYREDVPAVTPAATGDLRVQQFSFNTPYGADAANSCGRVAYS